jgi:hypothetical protein
MQPHRNFDGNLAETLPVFTWDDLPADLKTRSAWRRKRRKVRKGAKPVARLTWDQILAQNADATVTNTTEQRVFARECGLYSFEQTAPYRGTARTLAVEIFWRYYVEDSSRQYHICWAKGQWNTCHGRLDEARLKSHLNGKERYGIRGGDSTRFLAVDLDLHDGDPDVFLNQLRVLIGEFHGKNGWHFQVADENAGGIHLIRCFRHDVRLEPLRKHFRKRLQELDQRHPELAVSARAAGMKTLGELEIFPDTQKGFRLPLCLGRTMLLDRPLPLVFNKRMGRDVQDVLGYITWLSRGQKTYMPADEVIQFVQQRLKPVAPKPKAQRVIAKGADSNSAIGEMADLGPMKGQYRQKLVEFWTGKNTPPDSLNKGIALVA